METTDRVAQVYYLRQLVAETYSNWPATLEDYEGDVNCYAQELVDYILEPGDMPEWVGAHDLHLLLRFARQIITGEEN